MGRWTRQLAPLVVSMAILVQPSAATVIPGGGPPEDDCLAQFEVFGVPTEFPDGPTHVFCTDCDPACDRDGVPFANGTCTLEVGVCLNRPTEACTPAPLRRARGSRRRVTIPPLESTECGPLTGTLIKARSEGLPPRTRSVKLRAVTNQIPRRKDRDRIKIACAPRPAGESCPVSTHEPCADFDPLRRAYFGDLHIHTRHSFDAAAFDVTTTPRQAYRFAKGEPVLLPPLDASGQGTRSIQIDRPLDFAAVTDHSEYLGEIEICTTPGLDGYETERCQGVREDPTNGAQPTQGFGIGLTPSDPRRFPELCADDGTNCRLPAMSVWDRIQVAAEAAYDRTSACSFTSFIAYEYTAATNATTNHRNVIFRNTRVPFPTSYFEQASEQGLWNELKTTCLDAGLGCDVLAIPHNSNESNGNMFLVEYPGATTTAEEQAAAAFRAAMEPVLEIYQHKGDSECRNGLSGIIGAPDELCEFEQELRSPVTDCGDGTGFLGASRRGCFSRRDFARGALLEGLKEAERIGVNPFPGGFIASTDTHNGTPGAVLENTFVGHRGLDDDTSAMRLGRGNPALGALGGISYSPGGLAGVWAEENTRDAIFDALRRREVFGTSGPRITPRFFGGWNLSPTLCADPDLVATAYATGVPMGGTLPPSSGGATAPSFLVSALRDPGGLETPLQRVQIIKGWREAGESHVQVYEVAGDPDNGASVDDATCVTSGTGFDSLCAVWTDPDFDPSEHAYYYARVVENPTCRWSTIECNALGVDCSNPASVPAEYANCCSEDWPRTIQERAWTSPIFFTPAS